MSIRRFALHASLAAFSVGANPLAIAAQSGVVRQAAAPSGWEPLARQFRDYVRDDRVVGASLVLVQQGQVSARLDIGQQDQAANVPVSASTIYHWGSITKTLTAIAIMQLRDRGKLTLDDPITRYVPELRQLHDPFGMIDQITLRMLLSHSAGFRNGTWPYSQGRAWEPFEPTTWNQLVAMMPYQELLFKPGSRYGYSNPAFVYLARVIEQISGDPWDAYVQKNIFAPLALHESYFRRTPYHLASARSHNYTVRRDSATGSATVVDNGADFDPGITTPNGGWNAPLGDLVRYVAFLTNQPAAGSPAARHDGVLSRRSLEEMWTPVVPMTEGYEAGANQFMGLSFFILGSGPGRLVGHTGSQAGFRSFFYLNPSSGAAVIAVFNTTNQAAPAAAAFRAMHQAAQTLIR